MKGRGLFAYDGESGRPVEECAFAEGDVEGPEESIHGKVRAVEFGVADAEVDPHGEIGEESGRALDERDQDASMVRVECGVQGSREASASISSIERVVEREKLRFFNRRSRESRSNEQPGGSPTAHSPHIHLQIFIPRRHRRDVPQHGRVQSDNIIQIGNDELGEAGPLVGQDPLGIRLDCTRVTDELLAEGDHKLVLGDIARVGTETAREELGIRSRTGVGNGLKELVEEGGRI